MSGRISGIAGTVADCSQACRLVEGISSGYLLADKGYDSDVRAGISGKMASGVIPLRKILKILICYGRCIYFTGNIVENDFLELNTIYRKFISNKMMIIFINFYLV